MTTDTLTNLIAQARDRVAAEEQAARAAAQAKEQKGEREIAAMLDAARSLLGPMRDYISIKACNGFRPQLGSSGPVYWMTLNTNLCLGEIKWPGHITVYLENQAAPPYAGEPRLFIDRPYNWREYGVPRAETLAIKTLEDWDGPEAARWLDTLGQLQAAAQKRRRREFENRLREIKGYNGLERERVNSLVDALRELAPDMADYDALRAEALAAVDERVAQRTAALDRYCKAREAWQRDTDRIAAKRDQMIDTIQTQVNESLGLLLVTCAARDEDGQFALVRTVVIGTLDDLPIDPGARLNAMTEEGLVPTVFHNVISVSWLGSYRPTADNPPAVVKQWIIEWGSVRYWNHDRRLVRDLMDDIYALDHPREPDLKEYVDGPTNLDWDYVLGTGKGKATYT